MNLQARKQHAQVIEKEAQEISKKRGKKQTHKKTTSHQRLHKQILEHNENRSSRNNTQEV